MLITCGSRQIKAKVFGGACSRRLFRGINVLGDNKAKVEERRRSQETILLPLHDSASSISEA